jgi:hypothetical protein
VEELRHDVEIIAQAHEREIEYKDATIDLLLKDLDDAEAQFETALRAHLRSIDRLLDIQDARLASIESDFVREIRTIEDEFAVERTQIMDAHRTFTNELGHTIKAIKEEESAKAAAAQAEFDQVREALKRRTLERIHVLESDQDAIMESLEKKLEEAHLQYLTNTDARTADFKALSERGQHDTQMNERQQRALKRLNKLLQLWRSKMSNNIRECEDRNETLEGERLSVVKHLDSLKASMARTRAANLAKMKAMSNAAQEVKQTLTENTALAQRLLTQAEALRAFESESEKVDPFAATRGTLPSLISGPAAEAIAQARIEGSGTIIPSLAENVTVSGDGLAITTSGNTVHKPNLEETAAVLDLPVEALAPGIEAGLEEAEQLHHFYGRYNKALIETLALEKQRESLRAEHAELQNLLQQTLDGLSVSSSAIDGANPLLIVNGRVPLNKVVPVRVVPKTIGTVTTEAAIVASTYARNGIKL